MDGPDYVWIVSRSGYSDSGGFYCFSSAHAAGAELERRGVGWRMAQHRIWDAPLMGAQKTSARSLGFDGEAGR